MDKPPVIAIDGPAGSGKGVVASRLAAQLGFGLLDSGVLYRVVALAALRRGIAADDQPGLAELSARLDVAIDTAGVARLEGRDVSDELRSDRVDLMASQVSAVPAVRRALLRHQLACRRQPGLVADGRDMGSVVFPDAKLRIFLTASPEERARRRYKQLIDKGIGVSLGDLLRDLKERDERDSSRSVSPLKPSEDSVVLDTTSLSIDQVVSRIMELAIVRLGGADSNPLEPPGSS